MIEIVKQCGDQEVANLSFGQSSSVENGCVVAQPQYMQHVSEVVVRVVDVLRHEEHDLKIVAQIPGVNALVVPNHLGDCGNFGFHFFAP